MNQSALFSLNKQSNAKSGKRQSFLTRARLCVFHSPAPIFLSETERFIPGHTRVFVLLPVVSGYSLFPFSTVSHIEIRHSIFALCWSLLLHARPPIPSHAQEIFFYYFSIILSFRVSHPLSLSIPIPVVVFTFITPVGS